MNDIPKFKIVSEVGKFQIVDENGFVYGTRNTKQAAQETLDLWIEYYNEGQ